MKSKNIRTPNLQEIFNQKSQYQQHKRKLHQIYQERKSQLCYDTHRMKEFDHIKESKARSFIHTLNRKSESISKENLKFLGRLENAKPSLSKKSLSLSEEKERTSYSFINPYLKKRMLDTQKQNMRISSRMKNMSSSLNQKSFMRDYAKSQQIKNRLMRYAADNEKVSLKSQRYFDADKSHISETKEQKKILKVKPSQNKKSVASHYRHQQILNNRVDTSMNKLSKIRAKNQRPNTSFQINKNPENSEGFFTTQPKKQKFYIKRRK